MDLPSTRYKYLRDDTYHLMDKAYNQKNTKINAKSLLSVHSKGYNYLDPITLDNPFIKNSLFESGMKVDPYKIKDKYLVWKEKTDSGISNISRFNSDLLKKYKNMEKLLIRVISKDK